ncbi:MAG: methyltransferase domain-containing protein [Flavobacteriaceae bacterium]|nr:MAG: methyltransferase domain-containing protein [Flavobacteriaceae bacterium]
MGKLRKPFQGVWNIIRFNWHFYIIAFVIIFGSFLAIPILGENLQFVGKIFIFIALITILVSLIVSWCIYDLSGFYRLEWLNTLDIEKESKLINIHAGFDETSKLLKEKYPNCELHIFDFYNPEVHTEVSIKRARKAYPSLPETKSIKTDSLDLADNSVDVVFLIFSAHEIRDFNERLLFFKELKRILKPPGKMIVTEHLRDVPNFIAYSASFFHFFTLKSWLKIFNQSDFKIEKQIKFTPFVNTFILK